MTSRKEFLAASSLFALSPAMAGRANSAASPYTFDEARFNAILTKPARHKQCFGATKLEGGSVIDGMVNSMNAYENDLHEGPGALHPAAVLYHGSAIALVMSNAFWDGYLVPFLKHNATFAKEIPEAAAGKGNPYLASRVADVMKRGASFFVCHNAISGLGYAIGHALSISVQRPYEAAMSGIASGALVVPAGVMAINACQEAKFTYIQSSL